MAPIPAKPDNLDGMAYDEALGGGVAQYRIPTVDTEGKDPIPQPLLQHLLRRRKKDLLPPNDGFRAQLPMTDALNYANNEQFFVPTTTPSCWASSSRSRRGEDTVGIPFDRNKLTYPNRPISISAPLVEGVCGAAR